MTDASLATDEPGSEPGVAVQPAATRGSASAADLELVARLRDGDESAFAELVAMYQRSLVRTAQRYVRDPTIAEEVVQDGWIAVLKGIDRFEGRSSLRTWIFRIVTFQAKSRGERERRVVSMSSLEPAGESDDGPTVDPSRFRGAADPSAGHWSDPPADWGADASARLLGRETQAVIGEALDALPVSQRTVMTLRDVRGFDSDEVCEALDISPGNQRVLLHRARAKVRAALERYLDAAASV